MVSSGFSVPEKKAFLQNGDHPFNVTASIS